MTDPKAGRKTRVLGDGRYVVRAKLGEGGMAVVYRAHDGNLDTDVVIKIPRPVLLADKEFKERFRREIRSLVTLSHPHIVKIHDVGEHNGVPFVVMQYLPGGSLEDRRKALRTMKSWLPQICSALDFIHSKGYVHRDIKPGNILFDDNGNAYLSDFGIVKAMADAERSAHHDATLTRTGMVVGTPDYMAPEVIMGEAYDGRADQYSLAVMVHEMLAGEKPFVGPTSAAVMVKHTSDPPPSLTTINPQIRESLAETIVRALAKDPDERFANCEEFWKALRSSSTGVDSGAVLPAAPSDWTESQSLTSEPTSTAQPSGADGRPLPLTGVRRQTGDAMGAILNLVWSVDAALEKIAGQGNEVVHNFLRGAVVSFPCLLVLIVVLLWPSTPEPTEVASHEFAGAKSDATSSTGSERDVVAEVEPKIGESLVDEELAGQSGSGSILTSELNDESGERGDAIVEGHLPVVDGSSERSPVTQPAEQVQLLIEGAPTAPMTPGDVVELRISTSDESPPSVVRLEGKPAGMAFDSTSGECSWQVGIDQAGKRYTLRFSIPGTAAHRTLELETKALPFPKTVRNSVDMTLVLIPAGVLYCEWQTDRPRPLFNRQPLYLGSCEVTQIQYSRIMGRNPSRYKGAQRPAESMGWLNAARFCNKLSEKEGLSPFYLFDGDDAKPLGTNGYRMPRPGEWCFAAFAGTDKRSSLSFVNSSLDDHCWWGENSRGQTHDVGTKRANPFGLYDMFGNVWEYAQYPVFHGGWAWFHKLNGQTDGDPRIAFRTSIKDHKGGSHNGFRVARNVD